jgi:hypothetical protein
MDTKVQLESKKYFWFSIIKWGNYWLQQFAAYIKIARKQEYKVPAQTND